MNTEAKDYYQERRLVFIIANRQYGRIIELLREYFSVLEIEDTQNKEDIILVREKNAQS